MSEGPASSQGGGSAQTPTGSESSGGGRRPAGGGKHRSSRSNALIILGFVLVDDLSELSNNPQFQALRQLIQQNPEQLQTLMQTLQATQPELFQVGETNVAHGVHCFALLAASS